MDDIGNLVYILVFIVWFLYRTFGKGSKKRTKPFPSGDGQPSPRPTSKSGPTEATPPPVTFEDILRELTGAPPAPQPQPEVLEEESESTARGYYPEVDQEPAFEVLETKMEVPKVPKVQPDWRFKEFAVKRDKSSKAARAAIKAFRSKQGARQAFIMKEIFDRKY